MTAKLFYLFRLVVGDGKCTGVDLRPYAFKEAVSTLITVELVAVAILTDAVFLAMPVEADKEGLGLGSACRAYDIDLFDNFERSAATLAAFTSARFPDHAQALRRGGHYVEIRYPCQVSIQILEDTACSTTVFEGAHHTHAEGVTPF